MKKYLLLASVAGCLLAHNAMADDMYGLTGTLNVAATFLPYPEVFYVTDVNFGKIILTEGAVDDDIIATFTNGVLSFTDGKVLMHSGEQAGVVSLSGATSIVTGLAFSSTTVDLVNSSSDVVAQMVNVAASAKIVDPEQPGWPFFHINGQLKLKNKNKIASRDATALSGSTTITLQY